jgi:hypothetical protein
MGLSDAALARDPGPASGPRPLALLTLPLAMAGAAAHVVPYRLTGWITRRSRPDPTKEATVRFSVGAGLFALSYLLQGLAAWRLWGPRGCALYLAAISVAGLVTLRWLRVWQRAWGGVRLLAVGPAGRRELARLRAERVELAAEARRLWEAFRAQSAAW